VVFLGVGFETTTPTVAAALAEAEDGGVANFAVLSGHKVMPPPLRALAGDPEVAVDGSSAGHVSVITGWRAFSFIPEEFGLPPRSPASPDRRAAGGARAGPPARRPARPRSPTPTAAW